MLIDIAELERGRTVETDVCVVGAGVAGITLAREFLGGPERVVLLESGGADYEGDIQALARGANEGLPYYELADARLRFFGGTTAIWGGRCAMLDAIDLRPRSWVPHSGWPIPEDALEAWYERARAVLALPPRPSQQALWEAVGVTPPAFEPSRLRAAFWEFDEHPGRFGLEQCGDLVRSSNVSVVTHATVTHVQARPDGGSIAHVDVADPGGHRARIAARYFVLAAGGLENPRLLLDADDVHPRGLGNGRDLVGRFFMEHPHARGGRVITNQPWRLLRLFATTRYLQGRRVAACMRPAEAVQAQRRALNTSFVLACRQHPEARLPVAMQMYRKAKHQLTPSRMNRGLWLATKKSAKWLQRRTDPLRPWLQTVSGRRGLYAVIRAEQSPDPASRVRLGEERDALGMRRLVLDWRLNALDKHGARVAMETLDQELRRLGLGRLEAAPWLYDGTDAWAFDPLVSAHPIGGFHHMGTTRMADHPARGVVDPDGRVFELDNLYVAGSSVFPTGGWANPTLTLLALTLRLGRHLRARCTQRDVPGLAETGRSLAG